MAGMEVSERDGQRDDIWDEICGLTTDSRDGELRRGRGSRSRIWVWQ